MKNKKFIALFGLISLFASIPMPSCGAWIQNGNCWFYEENNVYETNNWKLIDGVWYYFDSSGHMATGWKLIAGKWYFMNPISDGTKGKMLTGWQWIDGHCYYLAANLDPNYPEGSMYSDTQTPDGFQVNSSGAWINEDGIVQYQEGKGIQSVITKKKVSSRGGFGGGGSGHSRPGTINSAKPQIRKPEESQKEPAAPSNVQPPKPVDNKIELSYTIKYLDVESKTVLKLVTGKNLKDVDIIINPPELDGYEICSGQEKQFRLATDGMKIIIYYSKLEPASPSEAKKVTWKLYFVEEDNHSNEIFKSQSGQSEEDVQLAIDFPETILGKDRYYYHSLVPSPWNMVISGTGTQKYYVEFERGEKLPEEDDPDQDAGNKLRQWLETAREADFAITGDKPTDQQLITKSLGENNERLLNLATMADSPERMELYLIAKNHTPAILILSQKINNIKNLSQLVMAELAVDGDIYTVMRVGFEKTYEESTCNHDHERIERVEPTCSKNGYEIIRCRRCGKEENVILPAEGHADIDHDGICDICFKPINGLPEAVHYSIGDIQTRIIGKRNYLFRCIDEDYEDAIGNRQKTALFLCDSVIRSDIIGASKKLNFGDNNNYKYSKVREWLQNNAVDSMFLSDTYVGITKAFLGSTRKGTYDQLNESGLMGYDRLYQSMNDKVLILSVEESLKYRDYLWKFNGSDINNPESQISAYSKGYYLRTPQDGGRDEFGFGEGIYTVSLTDGNIQPVNVSETGIGIRPAIAIPQE